MHDTQNADFGVLGKHSSCARWPRVYGLGVVAQGLLHALHLSTATRPPVFLFAESAFGLSDFFFSAALGPALAFSCNLTLGLPSCSPTDEAAADIATAVLLKQHGRGAGSNYMKHTK